MNCKMPEEYVDIMKAHKYNPMKFMRGIQNTN